MIARDTISRALEPLRAGEWWDHKLAPMLGTGYMTAVHLGASLSSLWVTFVVTLLGVAAAAAYVSVIGDVSDLDSDAAAGKYNRLAERRPSAGYIAIAGTVALGVAIAVIAWRHDPLALGLFAGPWLAFSLYSLPPVRLKARGAAGAVADASGAHLFPSLLIAVAVFHGAHRPIEAPWIVGVGAWALAAGIRGALWHQLGDVQADARSGVNTFGRINPDLARYVGRVAFAVECIAFAALLWRAASPLAFVLIVPYLLLELSRVWMWGVRLIVATPAPTSRIAMHDYYLFFYPLAFLVTAAIKRPGDLVILLGQAAIFPRLPLEIASELKADLRRLAVTRRTGAALPGRSRS